MTEAPSAAKPSIAVGGESTNVPTTRLPESRVISEVFLSPRVIDREAYEDYAGSLRKMIEEAARATESLRTAANDAQLARGALREVANQTQPKLEAAARVMATIDARAGEAEALQRSAREVNASLQLTRQEAEDAIRTGLAGLEMRLAALDQRVEDQVRLAEQRAAQMAAGYQAKLEQKLVEMEARQAGISTTIDTLAILIARAEGLVEANAGATGETPTTIGGLVARGERVQQATEQAVRDLESLQQRADTTRASLTENIGAADRRLEQLGSADQTLRSSVTAAQETVRGEITAAQESLRTGIAAAKDECQQAEVTLAARREQLNQTMRIGVASAQETLRIEIAAAQESLKTGIAAAQESLRTGIAAAKDECQQAEVTLAARREQLNQAMRTGVAMAQESLRNEIATVQDSLRAGVAAAQEECRQAEASLVSRREELQQALREPTDRLEEKAVALEQRISIAGRVAGQSTAGAVAVVERLGTLVDELKPWQPILLEERADGELPGALAVIVDRVKADLAGDLTQITGALQSVLNRTKR